MRPAFSEIVSCTPEGNLFRASLQFLLPIPAVMIIPLCYLPRLLIIYAVLYQMFTAMQDFLVAVKSPEQQRVEVSGPPDSHL